MTNNLNNSEFYEKSPLYQLLLSLLIVLVIGFILFSVFLGAGLFFFDLKMGFPEDPSSASCGKEIAFLKYILISQGISFFIVPSIIILLKLEPGYKITRKNLNFPRITDVGLVVILAFCIFPLTSFTGLLNSRMHLPDWLSGMEQWMRQNEDHANNLIKLVLARDSFVSMFLDIIMIAVLPAIGEELIFRGVFQTLLQKLFRSDHLAVWVVAFVFSAVHFQFFGFLPRFILGLVFGYLFLWSRNLWLPIISHFSNNAFPVVGAYLHGWETSVSQQDISLWEHFLRLPVPFTAVIMIMIYLWNKSRKRFAVNNDETKFKI